MLSLRRMVGWPVPVWRSDRASLVFLAIGKLLLGLVFGNSFMTILGKFSIDILGIMPL